MMDIAVSDWSLRRTPRDAVRRRRRAPAGAAGLTLRMESRKLNFFYGSKQALCDISLPIREKTVTAFIGPSGCGKSTFLRCLNRMNDIIPDTRVDGDVLLDGDDIYGVRAWTSSTCAGASGWSSRSRTRSRSRSSTTSPTA